MNKISVTFIAMGIALLIFAGMAQNVTMGIGAFALFYLAVECRDVA